MKPGAPVHFPSKKLIVFVACLLGSILSAPGQLVLQTLQASVNTLTVGNTQFANAGYPFNGGINVSAVLEFSRTGILPSSEISGNFRIGWQLLDDTGTPVQLDTGSGTSTIVYDDDWDGDADAGFSITLGDSVQSIQETGFMQLLRPVDQLNPTEVYTVRAIVYWQSGTNVFGFPIWSQDDTEDAAGDTYIHFVGELSGDDAVNTLSVLNSVSFSDRSALAGAQPAADAYGFEIETDVTFHRFDDWLTFPSSSNVEILYSVELWRVDAVNGDEQIPLQQADFSVQQSLQSHTEPFFNAPYSLNTSHFLRIVPDGVQLDSVNETYYATVTIGHVEDPVLGTEWTGNTESGLPEQLMHFNGSLDWGGIQTLIGDFTNDPAASGSWSASYIDSGLSGAVGAIAGNTGYIWGPTSPTIRLQPDGSALVISPSFSTNVTPPSAPDIDATAGIRFQRSNLILDHGSGLTATLTVFLPTGMGWASSTAQSRFSGKIEFSGQNLTQDLQPVNSSYTFSTGSDFFITEETKPLGYEATALTWDVNNGLIQTTGTGAVRYLRDDELASLEASPVAAEAKLKRSNEQYYRAVGSLFTTTQIPVIAGPSGDARLSADFNLGGTVFTTHFPHDVEVDFTAGYMAIVDDQVDVSSSYLDALSPLDIAYNQACLSDDCGVSPMLETMRIFSADNQYRFTSDGGLVTEGLIDNSVHPDQLAWGFINNSSLTDYHHETSPFAEADFHMPGHFIRGDQDSGPDPAYGPGVILYTGVLASDPQVRERPGTAPYLDGLADYAGFNLRTVTDSSVFSDSVIAGVPVFFDLTGRCKYYIRKGGVTGIHEAVPGTFPAHLTLYGYNLNFQQYGLNYRFNDPDESRTEGVIQLPYPSDFSQPFEEMAFSCLGGLEEVKIPAGTGDQVMSYWLANISILSLTFASENGCDPTADTYLLAGVAGEAAYVDVPLYGTLGFLPNGQLMIPSSSSLDVNSRLHLPSVVRFDGPTRNTDPEGTGEIVNEVYELVPATLAYYNDFASTTEQNSGDGKINFAGSLDVAFFEDLQVHMQTSAQNVLPSQSVPIFLMGGWSEGFSPVKTFFNSVNFDSDNTGFPAGVNEALYRNESGASGDPSPYLIHARQDWLGVVNFDYPLKWSTSTRSFESYEPKTNDFLVISSEHKLEYLSAETAELTLGITYEGMPEISLTNFVLNAVDEQTGVYQAMLLEAKKPIVDAIESGIDEMADMVQDRMDAFFDDFFALTVEQEVVCKLYDDLHEAATTGTYDPTAIQNALQLRLKTGSTSLQKLLNELATGVGDANYLFSTIDSRLQDIELGLTAIIDGAWVDINGDLIPDPGGIPPDFPALLAKNLNGDFEILAPLVERLLAELAPEVSDELNALLSGAIDDLNARINELLEEVKPSLDQIVLVLTDLRDLVVQVRTAIAPAGTMLVEMQTIINSASAEIDSLTTQIQTELDIFFNGIPNPDDFLAYTSDEIKERIRTEIKDLFFGTDFVAQVQVTLKQYLYDVDAAINTAISDAFAQLNKVIRSLVSDALSEVDDSIAGFLGDVDSVLGAGKINGSAQFNGDALRRLHIDVYLQLMIPDEMEFNGFLTIEQRDSEGDDTCSPGSPGGVVTEVTAGATDVPADWISPDLRISLQAKFNFQSIPDFKLLGLGGALELTGGEIGFETFKITDMGAALMFGASENYIAAKLGLAFNSYEAFGGVYFGRTCTIDPLLLVDEDVAEVLGSPAPTFTGIYVYGECHIPISEAVLGIPASCLFRISAGVGAGAFYFTEGNTLGGKIYASASGEALCIVSIKGEVTMIGLTSNGELSFRGKGRLSGKVGACPFCIKFGKTAIITYQNGNFGLEI